MSGSYERLRHPRLREKLLQRPGGGKNPSGPWKMASVWYGCGSGAVRGVGTSGEATRGLIIKGPNVRLSRVDR